MKTNITMRKAELYHKHRLPYAPEAAEALLAKIGRPTTIADIGAGTGQLSKLFAPNCDTIHAIEPDDSMRAVATSTLANFPNIEIRDATAEQTSLPDNSVDLILIGNAFHRFKPEACQELKRILKPQGSVALFSYQFPNQAYMDMLNEKLTQAKTMRTKVDKNWHNLPIEALFGDVPTTTLRFSQSSQEGWSSFFGAACARMEAPEPNNPEFPLYQAIHQEIFDAFAINGQIEIVYKTQVLFGTCHMG